ncbi:hypothetical protein [Brevundimonas sp.]|uniref:hypothetical protein n=1 Tax=Brevundimonas sp. TaxID=1871086 RepID=UPI002899FE32|nr:hypothetical protein [Brevundimonas sp.]
MKRAAIPLLLLVVGCAPKFDQAGARVHLNAGYSQLSVPSEERSVDQVGTANSRDLALWLTPERADRIETAVISSSMPPAPPGSVVITLVETPGLVAQGVCQTAKNSFFGEDETVRGKPTVRVGLGSRQVLYRAADTAGGCTKAPDAPDGFSALSPEAAMGVLRAYGHALAALSHADRNADTARDFLAPSQIVSASPCLGETHCLSFALAPSPAAPHGWDVTYRYRLGRQAHLSTLSKPPPS